MLQGLYGIGDWQQLALEVIRATPAEVAGDPGRFNSIGQLFQSSQVLEIKGLRTANGQGDTVHNHRIAFGNLIQCRQY